MKKHLIWLIVGIIGTFVYFANAKEGDNASLLFMFLCIILIIWKFVKIKEYIKQTNSQKQPTTRTNTTSKTTEKYDFLISIKGMQLLESLYIIQTTKNLDILQSRIEFINQIYKTFIINAEYPERYRIDTYRAIDEYKVRYYDRTPTEEQLFCIVSPDFDKLNFFYSISIADCCERYVNFQNEQLKLLKRQSAIDNRIKDIIDKGMLALSLYSMFDIPEHENRKRIEDIINQFQIIKVY